MIYFLYVVTMVCSLGSILKLGVHIGRVEANKDTGEKVKFDWYGIAPMLTTALWGIYLLLKDGIV